MNHSIWATAARRFTGGAGRLFLALLLVGNVMAQPVIDVQPVDQTVAVGDTVLFQILATSTEALSFQWRCNGIDLEGATRSLLRITNVQPSQEGTYTVLVTDAGGSTISEGAALTVDREWILYNRRNSGLPYDGVVDLEVDRDGNVWVATGRWNAFEGGGLAKFNGREWTVYQTTNSPLPANDCTGLAQDATGNLWVSTELGLARFDRANEWGVVSRSQFWFPALDFNGRLWVGSSSGVCVYDGAKWTCYRRANSGLPNDFVNCITVDADDRKWISTRGGLAVFDDENWTIYNRANSGLPSDTLSAIAFDEEGIAWITTWGGGVARFDGGQWTVYDPGNSGLPNANVNDLLIDSTGAKWIATEGGGVARFDGANWTTYNRANSRLRDDFVQALAFDGCENLWLGMKNGGVAVFRKGGVIPRLQMESMLADGEGHLVLRWTGGKGPYQVQSRASLSAGGWEHHGSPTDQTSLSIEGKGTSQFFRVLDVQP